MFVAAVVKTKGPKLRNLTLNEIVRTDYGINQITLSFLLSVCKRIPFLILPRISAELRISFRSVLFRPQCLMSLVEVGRFCRRGLSLSLAAIGKSVVGFG